MYCQKLVDPPIVKSVVSIIFNYIVNIAYENVRIDFSFVDTP